MKERVQCSVRKARRYLNSFRGELFEKGQNMKKSEVAVYRVVECFRVHRVCPGPGRERTWTI